MYLLLLIDLYLQLKYYHHKYIYHYIFEQLKLNLILLTHFAIDLLDTVHIALVEE